MNRFFCPMRLLYVLVLCSVCLASCEKGKRGEAAAGAEEDARPVSAFSKHMIRSEKVFPESVLEEWGYLTTEFEDGSHHIRSKKNYGDSREAFYARFYLAKARIPSEAGAEREKERIEALLKTEAGSGSMIEMNC